MKKQSRKAFLRTTGALAAGAMVSTRSFGSLVQPFGNEGNPDFEQQPLPYAYPALEPVIDSMTMEIHYSKHAAAYCKNLKEAALAEGVDMKQPLVKVLQHISGYSMKMRNNGGGHYNHELFWSLLSPTGSAPSADLQSAIVQQFGSLEAFKNEFAGVAKARFGSGWAWLVLTPDKKLSLGSTPNQDNPLMDVADLKGCPLLALDVWEHAYYLKYQNRRADYIDQFWKIVHWEKVSALYAAALRSK